jgi:energy-coupling factor transport system permease protein
MLRDITLGQYYPADSCIHRLDPRTKVLVAFLFVLSLFCFHHFAGYAVVFLFFVIVQRLSHVPFRYLVRGLKPVLLLLLFTALINIWFTPGVVIWQWKIFRITWQGLMMAGFMLLRLGFLVLGSSLMTLTTTPTQLTDALEKIMRPLNHFHVPVHEVAMMISIALRFIPILLEETDRIMKAQIARGADFESGPLWQRFQNMLPILVPLFLSATRRAGELAYAMDARCYHGGAGRTKMKPLQYQKRDAAAYFVFLIYILLLIILVHIPKII